MPGFYGTHALDRAFKANLARLTNGISPAGMMALYVDWLAHLALSPGKQLQLAEKATRKAARLALYLGQRATAPTHRPASSHCRRTGGFAMQPGSNGRSI